jgi:hypothetical protein
MDFNLYTININVCFYDKMTVKIKVESINVIKMIQFSQLKNTVGNNNLYSIRIFKPENLILHKKIMKAIF